MTEADLIRKLLSTLHLSVVERRALPEGRARLSILVAVLEDALADSGWFPFEPGHGNDVGDGAVVQLHRGQIWVHEQHEVGVGRYGAVRSFRVANARDAIRAYITAHGGDPIDGVSVDWEA
jgi:hypothetical protein